MTGIRRAELGRVPLIAAARDSGVHACRIRHGSTTLGRSTVTLELLTSVLSLREKRALKCRFVEPGGDMKERK